MLEINTYFQCLSFSILSNMLTVVALCYEEFQIYRVQQWFIESGLATTPLSFLRCQNCAGRGNFTLRGLRVGYLAVAEIHTESAQMHSSHLTSVMSLSLRFHAEVNLVTRDAAAVSMLADRRHVVVWVES